MVGWGDPNSAHINGKCCLDPDMVGNDLMTGSMLMKETSAKSRPKNSVSRPCRVMHARSNDHPHQSHD